MAVHRTRARAIAILLLVLAALVFWLVVWLRSSVASSPSTSDARPEATAESASATTLAAPPSEELAARDEARAPRAEAAREPLAVETGAGEAVGFERTLAVLLRFLDGDGRPIRPEALRISLATPGRAERIETSDGETSLLVRHLAPALYTLTPLAAPYHSNALPLDLRAASTRAAPDDFEPTQPVNWILWDAQHVLVFVSTRDGRPLHELVPDGVPGGSTFAERFDVQVLPQRPAVGDWPQAAGESAGARIVRPALSGWDSGGAIVALELAREPPLWVGLGFGGVALEWQRLERDQRELHFELDAATVGSLFAQLALSVLDESGGACPEVSIELRAEPRAGTSMFLAGATTDALGRAQFPALLPGHYAISWSDASTRGEQPLELAAGERRRLEFVLPRDRAPVELRVVDRDGQPADAWIQVGKFRPGAWHDRSYPALLHEQTQGGAFRLPLPNSLSIVRARTSGPRDHAQTLRSRPLLLDPTAPPKGVVTLVLEPLTQVEITHVSSIGSLIVHDELGLLVFEQNLEAQRSQRLELLRGRYTLELLRPGATESWRTEFDVGAAASVVTLP